MVVVVDGVVVVTISMAVGGAPFDILLEDIVVMGIMGVIGVRFASAAALA